MPGVWGCCGRWQPAKFDGLGALVPPTQPCLGTVERAVPCRAMPCFAMPCQQEILTPPQSLVAPRGPDCPGEAAGWAAVEQGGKNA